jgi:hypothetical protein
MVVPYDLAEEGGVKRHAMQLAASLRTLGDEVDVLGPCSDRSQLDEHTYGFRGVGNIRGNGSDNYLGIFACPWKAWRLVRRRRYDVVHIHEPLQPSLNYYVLWSARKAARICRSMGSPGERGNRYRARSSGRRSHFARDRASRSRRPRTSSRV